MPQEFEIRVEAESGIQIVSVKGALDSATMDQFLQVMMPIMNSELPRVILYCRDLTYLNSRSLGHLTQWHRVAMVKHGRLVFWGMSKRLVRAFDRLRVKDSLTFCESREEAMGKFAD